MMFVAMKPVLPWKHRIAYNESIFSPMMLNFNTVRDIPQLNKCTKFQLILT